MKTLQRMRGILRGTTEQAQDRLKKESAKHAQALKRRVRRDQMIDRLAKEAPAKAAKLLCTSILEDVMDAALAGRDKHVWKPGVRKALLGPVIERLRAHDLEVLVQCGHGHGGETAENRCNGTMYTTCWIEAVITW